MIPARIVIQLVKFFFHIYQSILPTNSHVHYCAAAREGNVAIDIVVTYKAPT